MAAQAAIEGRFLGGRPPYGYQLVDAGPHPNPGKAAIGQRLHQLAPIRSARRSSQRIFAEYLDGAGLHAIAAGLTRRRHPLPVRARSRAQLAPRERPAAPGRSPPSARSSRTLGTPAIRSGTSSARTRCSSMSRTSRSDTRRRCAGTTRRLGSGLTNRVHEPLVTHRDVRNRAGHRSIDRKRAREADASRRAAATSSRACCAAASAVGACRASGTTASPTTAASTRPTTQSTRRVHPKSVYVRENAIVPGLDGWLASLFDEEHLDHTCEVLAGSDELDPEAEDAPSRASRTDPDMRPRRLARYRELARRRRGHRHRREVDRRGRARAQGRSGAARRRSPAASSPSPRPERWSRRSATLSTCSRDADPADKAELYAELGVSLTYHTRRASRRPGTPAWGTSACRRGDLNPHALAGTSPSS